MRRTPGQVVDQLLWEGYDRFVPPVSRYGEPEPATADWKAEYDRLLLHHTDETDALLSIIRELARRLSP